ncbi:ABC transporter ATP-binding protein [Herbivorax sp. ANBcel31]|uniref:ABC transporter ATP-binding protein n=1 Tax=Herbivorax sp. ANBcel31 TaxID=3069754 RepID=UPI0027B27429|nr:ABC transporter ATP-binding protein [Herbivorax sp. ANBcel31]MDQ2085701.1 ABC transporter ATP-binding protein [Herbivorax sp. ANBcel31]
MKRLALYMKKYKWFYILALLMMFLSITLDMFSPRLIGSIVDRVIIGGETHLFSGIITALIVITVLKAIFCYIKEYSFDLSAAKVIMDLRQDMFNHIQKLSFSYFDKVNTGELMSRIKDDTENILHALAFGIMLCIEQALYFLVASVLLFTLSWKLALLTILIMPFLAYVVFKLEKRVGETHGKISDQRAALNTTAQENIAGVRLVKAFAREKFEINKFLKKNQHNYRLNMEQTKVWGKYFPKIEFLSNFIIVLVVTVGGFLVIGDEISLGTLVAFSNYIFMLIWPMRMMGWLTNIIAQCYASLKKVEKIFKEQPDIKSPENPLKPREFNGHVVFKDVFFEYKGIPVLKNININAQPGTTVAIMGITGSGKTSLINLIGRFYDVSSGSVLVNGIDVKDMDLDFLRSKISIVMQDVFLFSDSIEENIKFGVDEASEEKLISVSKDANAYEFISKMPQKFDTVIGERGVGLSGGQKQRISIARAFMKDAKILILDDATSALDMETEHDIQKSLNEHKGVTKFIIAHRISAVKNADEILIFEDGEIVERGKHQQLLDLKGKYYETYLNQLGKITFYDEEEVV